MPGITPSQTVGPFLSIGLSWPDGPYVVAPGAPGAIRIHGHLIDGAGDPVADGLIETWQLEPAGFGRCPTDADGAWEIHTRKPGRVGGQAPHIAVSVFARGLLNRVVTRIYFPDEPAANAADPLLGAIADPAARSTLIAAATAGGYRFDVHLQGPNETVFLAI
jgi:protocatechuate 3,4-dioxygenase, alpha subunit